MPGLRRTWWLLLAALWAGMALAQPAPPAPTAQPKIVVQAMYELGFDAAAWSPDGRFIWTASGLGRELLLWDAEQGIIIGRLLLPTSNTARSDPMRLTSMTMAPDGQSLRIDGIVLDVANKNGFGARGVRLMMRTPAAPPRVQEPSLFDFSSEDSPVVKKRP